MPTQVFGANDSNFGCKNMIELDASLPKLSIVQQDISRVLLNIFNNAFYAVNQLHKKADMIIIRKFD